MSEKTTVKTFCHAGNTGDLIASLPSLRQFYKEAGVKPNLYLIKDHPAEYYAGATHPVKDESGKFVSLNETMIKMVTPLLEAQDYLDKIKMIGVDDVEGVDYNLSLIRDNFVNCPYGDLRRWYFYLFPSLACDLSEQYLFAPDAEKDLAKGKIVISRSERYRNEAIDYSFIKEYEDNCVFVGTMREYNNFCMSYDLQIRKLNVNSFLELAQALKQCKFHLSNQTMAFQISEGLKVKRVVELCSYAPNVIPTGKDGYDFYHQGAIEWYFKRFMK